jgi:hypothetical protein
MPRDPLGHALRRIIGGRSIEPHALWLYKPLLDSPQVVRQAGGPGLKPESYAQAASDLLHQAVAAIHDKDTKRVAEAMFCIGDHYNGNKVGKRKLNLHDVQASLGPLYEKRREVILLHVYNYLTVGAPQPAVNVPFARTAVSLAYAALCIDWLASVSEARSSDTLPYGDAQSIAIRQVRAQYSLVVFARLVQPLPPQTPPEAGSAEDVLRVATGGSFRQLDPLDAARAGATSSN